MALPEFASLPDADQEHTAVVCLPCPKCGDIIRTFKVRTRRRKTATVHAECPNCRWTAEADQPVEDLGLTSLAPPTSPTDSRVAVNEELPLPVAYKPSRVANAIDLDAPIFASAPEAAHLDEVGALHVDADAEIDIAELDALALLEVEDTPEVRQGGRTGQRGGRGSRAPLSYPSSSSYRSSSSFAPEPVRRTKREAWLLTGLCFVALSAGALELIFLAKQLAVWHIVLVVGLLLPVTSVLLIHGLRGVWQTTHN